MTDRLRKAAEAAHGDNCYVSDCYPADPGNKCWCDKEAILAHLEEAIAAAGGKNE